MCKKIIVLLLFVCVSTSFLTACHKKRAPLGTKENPISFYFMPLKGQEVFTKNSAVLKNYLENKTGFFFKTVHAPDFANIVQSLGDKKADLAFINTLGYLLAHDWANAEAKLRMLYGDVYDTYKGEILVRTESKINKPSDLNGKVVAFSDPYSTAGYIYALKYFNDNNIKPKKTIFAGGHKKAVEMLYKGEVDAAATYHARPSLDGTEKDVRSDLEEQYNDIFIKLKVLALTDEIPTGVVAFRKEFPSQIKMQIVETLVEFASTVEGRKALNELYNIRGFTLGSDKDYDPVRLVLKELGKNIEEVVPGGITFFRTHIETLPLQ